MPARGLPLRADGATNHTDPTPPPARSPLPCNAPSNPHRACTRPRACALLFYGARAFQRLPQRRHSCNALGLALRGRASAAVAAASRCPRSLAGVLAAPLVAQRNAKAGAAPPPPSSCGRPPAPPCTLRQVRNCVSGPAVPGLTSAGQCRAAGWPEGAAIGGPRGSPVGGRAAAGGAIRTTGRWSASGREQGGTSNV